MSWPEREQGAEGSLLVCSLPFLSFPQVYFGLEIRPAQGSADLSPFSCVSASAWLAPTPPGTQASLPWLASLLEFSLVPQVFTGPSLGPSLLPSSSFPSSLLCSKAPISSRLWTNECKEHILIDRTHWSPNFLSEALARSALVGGKSLNPSDFT